MKKQAVIYARVSTDEQAKGYSLSTQLDACRKYAIDKNYKVEAEFTEDYTGTVLDRPALNKLRERISKNDINAVIIYDIDRLARKAVYQMLIEEEFIDMGISVEYVIGQYDDSDEGRLQKQIRASIAEYEKAKIIERMKRGKRGKAQSGYVIVATRPPYGYKKKSEPHKAWLEINEDEARIVKLIFQWYLYGDGENGNLSLNAIARRLTQMGILTRGDKFRHVAKKRGRGVWQPATVRKILGNETYTGIWHYGKTKMVNDGNSRKRTPMDKRGLGKQVSRAREQWISVKVPAIIDLTDFHKVKERIQINIEQSKRNTKNKYLLGRRLRCAKCGYSYVGRTRETKVRKNQYYYCKGREQVPIPLCDMPNFRADILGDIVWSWLHDMLQHPANIADGLLDIREEAERANSAIFERLSLVKSQLHDTEEQLSRLLDLYLDGEFPKEMLVQRKEEFERKKAELSKEQADLSTHIQTLVITDEQIEEIEAFCTEIRDGLDEATFEEKRQILELFDVRGKLAIENNEKVIYISCNLLNEPQRRSLVQTSP